MLTKKTISLELSVCFEAIRTDLSSDSSLLCHENVSNINEINEKEARDANLKKHESQMPLPNRKSGVWGNPHKKNSGSVIRLSNFLKFWLKIFVSKVAQMNCDFWAVLKNNPFQVKIVLATIWAAFGNIWPPFYIIWSHWTVRNIRRRHHSKRKCLKRQKGSESYSHASLAEPVAKTGPFCQ